MLFLDVNEITLAKIDQKSETFEVNAGNSVLFSTQERSWFWILEKGAMTLSNEDKKGSSISRDEPLYQKATSF